MLKSWRSWVLIVLLVGPFAAYISLGFLWLLERGWLVATLASTAWIASGVVLYALAARWTKTARSILPPIDWNAPQTFVPADREAYAVVQEESARAEGVPLEALTESELYIETARRLFDRLAKHYHPLSERPLDSVPVVELITALELAAEDLTELCRDVPGGDLITPGHWKTAVQAAGYIQKANNIYSYILPLINPVTGIPRLASQHLMIKPAWKSMQENLLRWFYQAYVNRLGMHLIELFSGRLVIGAEKYRKLTRKMTPAAIEPAESAALTIAVAGARDSGHEALVAAIREAKSGENPVERAKLAAPGLDDAVFGRLLGADWVAVDGYTAKPDRETARDRATRRHAVTEATDADLLLLLIDDRRGTLTADATFATEWDRWYVEHPSSERPPAIAAVIATDHARLDSARAVLPPTVARAVAIDPALASPTDLARAILPEVAAQLPRAERVAILRQLQRLSARSKAGRLARQIGESGRWFWDHLRRPKPGESPRPADSPEPTTRV